MLTNDIDMNEDTLVIDSVIQRAHDSVINKANDITCTPDADYNDPALLHNLSQGAVIASSRTMLTPPENTVLLTSCAPIFQCCFCAVFVASID